MRMFLSVSGYSSELSIANHSPLSTVSQLKCVSDTISSWFENHQPPKTKISAVKWLFFAQRRGKGGAKGRLLRHALRYYIKQIDSMLPCVWFSKRSQKTSKCGKNISDTLGYASCSTFLFLPHFDVICDLFIYFFLLLNRCTATWNLFVK